jgi:hypothetical protein
MTLAQAEALRRGLLSHEAQLQSIGALMLLGTIYLPIGPPMVLLSLFRLVLAPFSDGGLLGELTLAAVLFGGGLLCTAYGALSWRAGTGLRRVDPKHLRLYTVMVSLWLLSFPLGSLMGGWALYMLHSSKGKQVFGSEYQEARLLTPHIQNKWSVWTWVLLGLLVLSVAALFALGQ